MMAESGVKDGSRWEKLEPRALFFDKTLLA